MGGDFCTAQGTIPVYALSMKPVCFLFARNFGADTSLPVLSVMSGCGSTLIVSSPFNKMLWKRKLLRQLLCIGNGDDWLWRDCLHLLVHLSSSSRAEGMPLMRSSHTNRGRWKSDVQQKRLCARGLG